MPPPVPRCGKGQHEAKQIPCEDQGTCSSPRMQGDREACSALGSGCSGRVAIVPKAKSDELLSASQSSPDPQQSHRAAFLWQWSGL